MEELRERMFWSLGNSPQTAPSLVEKEQVSQNGQEDGQVTVGRTPQGAALGALREYQEE